MTDHHTIPMTKERLRGLLWSVLEEEDITDPLADAVWERALRLEAWKP